MSISISISSDNSLNNTYFHSREASIRTIHVIGQEIIILREFAQLQRVIAMEIKFCREVWNENVRKQPEN